jgi:hypothetical protein
LFKLFYTGVLDTGSKFAACIIDTGAKFATYSISRTLAVLVAKFDAGFVDTIGAP